MPHSTLNSLKGVLKVNSCSSIQRACMLSCSIVSDSLQPTRLFHPWGFSCQEYWSGLPCPPLGDLPNSGIEPRSLSLQADSLPPEPPGKPKNTGVGSLSLLQQIFLTQKSNQGLLHWRWILYCLSHQGSWGSISVEADGKCNVLGKCQFVIERRKENKEQKKWNRDKITAKVKETKSWFFEKINQVDKPLAWLIKKKRERNQ